MFPTQGKYQYVFDVKEYIDKVIICPVKLPFRCKKKEKLPESVQKLAEVFKRNIDIMRKRYSYLVIVLVQF